MTRATTSPMRAKLQEAKSLIRLFNNDTCAVFKGSFIPYFSRTRESFRSVAKALGIMDDFKSGVPRMAYKGVVATMFRGQRIYVAPSLNWKGYDPSW